MSPSGSTESRKVPDSCGPCRRSNAAPLGVSRMAWWGLPSANTLDRATALLPRLMYERLDEMGVDVALLYPTYGLTVTATPDDELRIAMARAFNRYWPRCTRRTGIGSSPWRRSPCTRRRKRSPSSNHAVVELGLPVVMMAGVIPRPIPGLEDHRGGSVHRRRRPRQRVRLRHRVAALRRARRVTDLPCRRPGVGDPGVEDELRVQPHRQLRRRRRGRLPVTRPGGWRAAQPVREVRVLGGWRGVGAPTCSAT